MRQSAGDPNPQVPGFSNLELIDTGGFSRVFRAEQDGLDRAVVLKILNSEFGSAAKQKAFERECRAMGMLSQHPNIVTVFSAAFSAAGLPCIVMEYYEEGSLADRVITHGPLDPDQVIRTGILVCRALDAAHSAGITHRDIKPHNLFGSQYAQVVLGDFGISTFDDDRTLTQSGSGLTVHYAPPELLEGEAASAQSDVYSLAATLYFLASGEKPFPKAPGESLADVARRILIAPPPVLNRHGPNRKLGQLLAKAMAKDPKDRPASARAFENALSHLNDESDTTLAPAVLVAPDSTPLVPPGSPEAPDLEAEETENRPSKATTPEVYKAEMYKAEMYKVEVEQPQAKWPKIERRAAAQPNVALPEIVLPVASPPENPIDPEPSGYVTGGGVADVDLTVDGAISGHQVTDSESTKIVDPSEKALSGTESTDTADLTDRSSRRGLLIPVLAALALGLIVLFSLTGRDQNPVSGPETTQSNPDSFFGAPDAPTDISVTTDGVVALITWAPVDEAESYEVTRLDVELIQVVETPSSEIDIDPGERPCVKVRSIGPGGRLSLDSETACASE